MAACYDAMGKADMAASGYDWCLKEATALLAKAQEKAKAEPEQLSGARSLVGMVSEEYGLHLRSQGKHEVGRAATSAAPPAGTLPSCAHRCRCLHTHTGGPCAISDVFSAGRGARSIGR